jgi:hypothetical protein
MQPSVGFLDDIVDLVEDVVEATAELITTITTVTEERLIIVATDGSVEPTLMVPVGMCSAALEHIPEPGTKPDQASAKELLEVRKAIVASTEATAAALREAAESVQREAKAARKPRRRPRQR